MPLAQLEDWIKAKKKEGYAHEDIKRWLVSIRYCTPDQFEQYFLNKRTTLITNIMVVSLVIILVILAINVIYSISKIDGLKEEFNQKISGFDSKISSAKSEVLAELKSSVDEIKGSTTNKFSKIDIEISNVSRSIKRTDSRVAIIADELEIASEKLGAVETGLEGVELEITGVRSEIRGFEDGIAIAFPSVVKVVLQYATATEGVYTFGSSGSGAIVDPEGFVITNKHLLQSIIDETIDNYIINITLYERVYYNASIVGWDEDVDIAVLKLDTDEQFEDIRFASSDTLDVGDEVVALGHPLDLDFTATKGIISNLDRTYDFNSDGTDEHYIQTDTPLNPGNSGGPLINKDGRIVGISTAKEGWFTEGLGFAIPSNTAKNAYRDLLPP